MAELAVTIVYDKKGEDWGMAGLLNSIIEESGLYKNFAILQVEKRKWNETELEELIKLFKQLETVPEEKNSNKSIKKTLEKITKKVSNLPTGIKIASAVGGTLFFGWLGVAAAVTTYLVNGKINNDKIFESQQKYLVWKFFTREFGTFIEERV
jgi:hypothetical protein